MIELPGPLVGATWLADNLDDVLVADVRWHIAEGPMPEAYRSGHIRGSIFVDLDADLSAVAGERGRHPLPTAAAWTATRGRLGFSRPVIAVDEASGAIAARLWWMLDSIGHPCAVLDGGLGAWQGTLESGWVEPSPTSVEHVEWPRERFIAADEVSEAIDAGATLIDARSADRFAGEPNAIDARPGHIPGSASRPWQDNLTPTGVFRSPGELSMELHPDDHPELIASCGSGVTGCHNLLAARLAGHAGGRLYTGSWSEWSLDPARPVATDAAITDGSSGL